VEGQRSGTIVVGVHGDPLGDPPTEEFRGTIDCAFAGDGQPQKNPVTDSRWIIGTAEGECDTELVNHDVLKVTAADIRNVGFWEFNTESTLGGVTGLDFTPEVFANTFSMYPSPDAVLKLQNTRIILTDFANDHPRMTFGGGSQLVYSAAYSQASANPVVLNILSSRIDLGQVQGIPNFGFTRTLEFIGGNRDSLMRPLDYGFGCPAENPICLTTYLNISLHREAIVDINTDVAHLPGRAFDASFANLNVGGDEVIPARVEAIASDNCNVLMVEHLCAADVEGCDFDFYSCSPLVNRCTKFWHGVGSEVLDIVDSVVNQNAYYFPPAYPQEAIYDCKGAGGVIPEMADRFYSAELEPVGQQNFFPMIWTRYGDFDGDFDVDLVNFMRFASVFTGLDQATWYPIADWGTSYDGFDALTNQGYRI